MMMIMHMMMMMMIMQMILCENAESQRKVMEKKCEDMALRLRDSDRALQTMQKEVNRYQVRFRIRLSMISD